MRYIDIEVANEYVKGAGVPIGAAGSYSDVALRIRFGDMWDGLGKHITWLDANGENPTIVYLTTENYEDGCYTSLIPAEAKAVAGTVTMSIRGADNSKGTLTAKAEFKVLESVYDPDAEEAVDPTPTVAEQLQAEVDQILDTIADAISAADEAAESASAAAGSADDASASAENAAAYVTAAESWAIGGTGTRAGEDTDNAKYYKELAEEAAEEAIAVVGVAPATEPPLSDGIAAVGTSGKYAREDHVHPSSIQPATTAPLANGIAAVGTSAKYAREDHVHPSNTGVYVANWYETTIDELLEAYNTGLIIVMKEDCSYDTGDDPGDVPLHRRYLMTKYYVSQGVHYFIFGAVRGFSLQTVTVYGQRGGSTTWDFRSIKDLSGAVSDQSPEFYGEPTAPTPYKTFYNNVIATTKHVKDVLNRTSPVDMSNTQYTTYMARGEALFDTETTPTVNGCIAWQYG